jgi:hypothetical protein
VTACLDAKAGDPEDGRLDPRVALMLQEAHRHPKPIAAWGGGRDALAAAGVPPAPGITLSDESGAAVTDVLSDLGRHRPSTQENDMTTNSLSARCRGRDRQLPGPRAQSRLGHLVELLASQGADDTDRGGETLARSTVDVRRPHGCLVGVDVPWAPAPGAWTTARDPLVVELHRLLAQVVVLEQRRTALARLEGVVGIGDPHSCCRGQVGPC